MEKKAITGISDTDKKKLAQDFRKEVAKTKAASMGTAAHDMVQRVSDGQYKWVKKADVYLEDETKKRVAQSKPIRALRDGENSLSAKIGRKIDECRLALSTMEQACIIQAMEKMDFSNALSNLESRVVNRVKDLKEIENQIETQKTKDPVFKAGENLLVQLKTLKQNGEEKAFTALQKSQMRLLRDYDNRRKSLAPIIKSARHERFCIQQEYWRILQYRYKFYTLDFEFYQKQIPSLLNKLESEEIVEQCRDEAKALEQRYGTIQSRVTDISTTTPNAEDDSRPEIKTWDQILSIMESLLQIMSLLVDIIHGFQPNYLPDSGHPKEEDSLEDSPKHRMVFAEKKKK